MLTKADYQTALDVQRATDITAVMDSFADIMRRIHGESDYTHSHALRWED